MLKCLDVKNPHYISEGFNQITCDVLFEGVGDYIPYTATDYDTEEHGIKLYNDLKSGVFGDIKPFIPDANLIIEINKARKGEALEILRKAMTVYQIELTLGTISDSDKEKLTNLLIHYKKIQALDVNDINMVIPNL